MKNNFEDADLISLTIQLNELKAALDRCMRQENSFERSRQLYLEIKETECQLHALQWHPHSPSDSYATI